MLPLSGVQLITQGAVSPSTGRHIAVFSLLDTASLWQYGGPATNSSGPLLVGHSVQLEGTAPPVTGLPLRQPQGAQPLQLGNRPRGLWNGAVRMADAGDLHPVLPWLMIADI
jgi:hypothetical protein